MVLDHVWRMVFRGERVGHASYGLPDRGDPETAGPVARSGAGETVLLHRFADAGFHRVLGLHQFLAVLHYLERQRSRGNLLVSAARTGLVVGSEHGHHLLPFLPA